MVQFTIESEDEHAAERAAMRLIAWAREATETQELCAIELLGPAPATIYRVKNRYRWNLGLRQDSEHAGPQPKKLFPGTST